jgi:hypothetical protein
VQVANFGTLAGGAELFGDGFLEGEGGDRGRREFKELEVILFELRCRRNGRDRAFTHAGLKLDLHALWIAFMKADGIGGAAVVGQIQSLSLSNRNEIP